MAEERMIEVTDDSFATEVLDSQVPVLVDFWAPWCGPCKMAAPVLDRIAEDYEGRLKVCSINVERERQVATNFGIMGVPTIVLLKDGSQVAKVTSVTPNFENDLRQKIESHLE